MTNAHIALHYSNLLHFSYIPTFKHKKLINNPLLTISPLRGNYPGSFEFYESKLLKRH